MNILVSGATGFIGKHLIPALRTNGHNVHILVRPGSDWRGLGVQHVVEFADDIDHLISYFKENEIEGIIHLASLYVAEHQPNQIKDIVLSNIYLGTALLEAGKTAGINWFLNIGTIWQNYNVPDQSDEYNPVNLYAASKQAFMTMAKYYTETSSLRFCTLKLCDTYGPDDTRKKIFALFERISKTGEELDMSPGYQRLDIVHVDDVVAGIIKLAGMLSKNEKVRPEYVISSGRQLSLRELARLYEQQNGAKLRINWGKRPYRNREVMTPYKGVVLEGWEPKILLKEKEC